MPVMHVRSSWPLHVLSINPPYLLAPQIPHERYLADFLMRNNGFIPD
jgi:hypothetical protein